jgi:hypothetical protein
VAQQVHPRWRARWRAAVFHVMATAAATVTLGVLGALAVVGVMVLGSADGSAALTADVLTGGAASSPPAGSPGVVHLLGVVPVMVITGTGLGLVAGVLSAPWGRRRPPDWARPVVAGLLGAFHLAGVLERSRTDGSAVGGAELVLSVAVASALWTAIAVATVLGGQRATASRQVTRQRGAGRTAPSVALPVHAPSGRAWRETLGAAALYALTVTYLAVGA